MRPRDMVAAAICLAVATAQISCRSAARPPLADSAALLDGKAALDTVVAPDGTAADGAAMSDSGAAVDAGQPQPGPPDPLPFTPAEQRADGAMRLTYAQGTASDQNPCFSPDGRFLVFTRFERGYNTGPAHIMRLDLDGSGPRALTSGDYDDVNVPFGCFDRASGHVVFASDREESNDAWTVSTDSAAPELRRITDHGELPLWVEPVFSPDGSHLALEQDIETADELAQRGSIITVDLRTQRAAQLTNPSGELDDRLPSWSPDGTTILFQRRLPPATLWQASLIPAAGGQVENLSAKISRRSPGHDTDLSWTADGRFVLTSSDPDGIPRPNIFLLPRPGGAMIRVTTSPEHEDGAPCGAPSGLWVAFESHRQASEDSPADIWIIRMPDVARP